MRCQGIKNDGEQCTREAEGGKEFCWQHQEDVENKGGRPSQYDDVDLEEVREWAKEGLTDFEISKRLGITTTTLYDWKNKFSEFADALKKAKKQADFRVENSLYQRALGYQYDEVTRERVPIYDENGNIIGHEVTETKVITKEVKPNVTAQIFWLKNRQPHKWKDKKDIDITSDGKNISGMTAEEREKRRQELRAKLGED